MSTHRYRCPHCSTVYNHELHTRVHITRADDDTHATHHGFMPESDVAVVDESGAVVERRSHHSKDRNLDSLTRDDFPDDITTKRKHALLVAAKNPDIDNRRELTARTTTTLADTEYDAPAERTVGRAIDEFYLPHQDHGPETKAFSELKCLQQAIIIARLRLPDASAAAIANRTRCSESYPPQVIQRREYIVDAFETRVAAGETLDEIVTDELSAHQYSELLESGHVTDLPGDFPRPADATPTETDSTLPRDTESETDADNWGSPTSDHSVMTATPPTPATETEADGENVSGLDDEQPKMDAVNGAKTDTSQAQRDSEPHSEPIESTASTATQASHSGDEASKSTSQSGDQEYQDSVARELQKLQEGVAFFKDSVSPVEEPTTETAMIVNFARTVETKCEQIIHHVTEGDDVHRD